MCAWNKNRETTWSGTTFSLYKALRKKTSIIECDVSLNDVQQKCAKIAEYRIYDKKICKNRINNSFKRKIYEGKIKRMMFEKDDIVLEIGEYGITPVSTYIYQDLSIDSLIYFREEKPQLYKYSGFEDVKLEDLLKRSQQQHEFYKNSKGIFTMSKWLADNLINYSNIDKEKVNYVGAGINIDKSKILEMKKTNNKILFVGRDFFRKGGDLVYEAFKILKRKYKSDAELYVAGPRKWPLKDRIEGVNFLGDLSYDKLSEYFNKCDIFCLPSRFEAYGLVFIEALTFGLPCIGRNEFAMKEFIEDGKNGYLIEEDDPDVLAIKIKDLLSNKEILRYVRDNREQYIQQYSWNEVSKRILNIIEKKELEKEGGKYE